MFGQLSNGSWTSSISPATFGTSTNADTATAILILSDAVTRAVPVAVIAPITDQTNKEAGRSFMVDGTDSYHLDADSAIAEYLWDWNASDGVDWAAPNASGALATNPGYTAIGTYTITLRVKDNKTPAATSIATTTVTVTSLDVAPIAVAKPIGGYDGYAGKVGMPITLTGTDSYDPDGDTIVSYSWDFNGDGIYGSAADLAYGDPTLAVTTVTYPTPYIGSIGLRVTANGKTSSNISDIDIQAGDADLRIDSVTYSNTVRRTTSDVSIVVTNDPASGRAYNNVLLRLYNGDPYAGGGPVGAVQTLNFSAGQTITVNLTNVDLGGAPILWAFLDTNNTVLEYDELNNISGPTRLDPEIDVEQPIGTAITDAGTASNFGTLIIGETSLKTYTITNSGTLNLTGLVATKDGAHSGDFILTQPLASSLAPGASTTFTVTYTPTAADTRTAAVHITTNDFDEASFDIPLTGFARAYPTNITLSTATINENNAANATVGTLTTTDTNVADTHTYTLVAGTGDEDNASFTIAANALKLTPSADYETKITYNLRLRTTDQTGLTFEKAFVVTIVKLNEAPVLATTQLNPTSVESAGVATGTLGVNLFSASAVTDIDDVSASLGGGNIRVTFAEYITGDLIELPTSVTHSLNAVQLSGTNVQISNGSAWTTIATRDSVNTGIGKALTLTLNAAATEDNIGYVIDALMFRSTSDNPTVNQTKLTRTYSLVINDGNNNALAGGPAALDSNTIAGGTLTITPTNDFPVVDLNGATAGVNHAVTWTEVANGTHVTAAITSSATMTDADNVNFSSMNFTLGGVLDGNSEVVTIGGTVFPLATDASNSVVTGSFKVSYNSTTDVFTIEPNSAAYATLTSFQTLLNGVTYNNLTDNPTDGDRTLTVMVTDAGLNNLAGVGSVSSTLVTTTINVNPVNDQPVIAGLVAPTYFENALNAAAATLDATATVTDIDSPDYNGATLTVSGLVAAQDLVSLPIGAVPALDNVQLTGTNVEINDGSNWVVVGTATGGNGNNFVVTFNASATARSAELVLENLTFANSSNNPTLTRTLTLTLNDNDGNATQAATLLVTIKLDNDAPDITGTVGLAYTEQGTAAAFVSGATTSDPDQPTNFRPNATYVGNLRVALDGYVTGDLLSVAHIGTAAGQIGVSGTTISYANVNFATTTGGTAADLVITFSSTTATPAAVGALINALRYRSTSDDPTVNNTDPSRVVTVTFNDGGNTMDATSSTTALTDTLTGNINLTAVNDVPAIVVTGAASYSENGLALTVDGTTTVSDLDDTQMAGGSVSITTGFLAGDTLAVTDSINITGSYNAATGVMTLSGTDTLANYQTVLRSLTYVTASEDPTDNATKLTRVLTYSLTDANSDNVGAATGTTTKTINITPSNDKPVVTAGATLAYAENDAATAIDGTVTVNDADDTQITGATATISAGLTTGDLLALTAQNGISGSYTAGTGVLTLTGTTTLANYQTALRSVTYRSTSEDPTVTAVNRTVTWTVTDANSDLAGAQTSVAVTSTITITPSNDKPVVTAGATLAYTENAAALAIDGTVTVNDVDDTQITGATATISAGLTTGDLLAVATQNGISGIYTPGTGVLALTGTATLANYQTALRSVTYRSTSEDPTVSAVSRTVTWAVTDANSDLAGAQTSVAVTSTINITPSNDKPVVTAGATLAYAENAAATVIDGTMTVNDADDTQIAGATATISAGLTAGDLLAVTTQNGISGTYSAGVLTLTGTATLADYQTALRSVTYESTSEDPTVTAVNRTVTWAVTDANSDLAGAQTSVAVTSTITITPSNDKPVVTAGATLAYTENAAATAIDGTVTVNDADDTQITGATATISAGLSTGDVLAVTPLNGITGTYSSVTGVLTLSGTATLANYQAAFRRVTYQSTSEDPTATAVNRTVTWAVTDANSDLAGAQTSVAVTSTINITALNDLPVIVVTGAASFSENGLALTVDGTTTVADADDAMIDGGSVRITTGFLTGDTLTTTDSGNIIYSYDSANGVLTLSGLDTLANYQTVLRSLTYVTASEDPTDNATKLTRVLTYSLTDANSDNVGAATGTTTKTINITPINDKPIVTAGATLAYAENDAATAIDGTITVNDADDTQITGATATISAGLTTGDVLAVTTQNGISGSYTAGTGVLTLTGTTTLANYRTALRSVTYRSTSEDPTATAVNRTVTWAVTDANSDLAGAQTSVAVTSTITITPSNDKPVVTAGATLAYAENAAATAIDGTMTVSDADDSQITEATATISAGLTTGDLLAVTPLNGISGTYSAGTGVLTLTGTATLANYQAAFRRVTYQSTSDDPTATFASRTVTWAVTDANSDLAGAQTSVAVTSTINITPINDKPVVTAGATLAYAENDAATAIDGTVTVNDADDTQITGATATISAGLTTGDLLAVATQNGISGTYSAGVLTLTGTATLADYQTALRSVTYQSTSEDPTVTAVNRTVTWAVTDANSDLVGAQTSVAVTSTITITPSNDKPVVTAGATLAYTENAAATAIDGTMTVNDADDTQIAGATATISAGLSTGDLLAVTPLNGITGTYSSVTGVLTLSGTATLAQYQAAFRRVTYQSTSDDPTATFASRTVAWAVTDANSDLAGAQTSVAVTSTINLTALKDPPVIVVTGAASYSENGLALTVNGTTTVSDADDAMIDGGSVSITTGFLTGDTLTTTDSGNIIYSYDSANGVLTLSGLDTLANYQTVLRSLTYVTASEDPTDNATKLTRVLTYSLTDANSDGLGAATGTTTKTINITPINDKPIVTAGATLAYAENDAATAIDGTITVNDADDTQIAGATATISAGLTTGDLLAVAAQNGISGSYTAGTGVLTLTGTTTLANYRTALRSVTYRSTSEDPTATAVNRTVTWAVTDANSDLAGAQTSVAVTSTITITPSNDKPVVTAGATLAYTENAAATAIDGTMTVNDADDTQITGATATISAGLTTGDLLAVTPLNGISGTYSAGTGVLTLTGTATLANYQAAFRRVTYQSTSDDPTATFASRTVTWTVTDANSDLAGAQTSVAVTSTINITPSNDKPVVTAGATLAYAENEAATAIDGTVTVNDADDTQITGATATISAGLTAGDLLAVATQNGISGTYSAGVLTLTGTATLADYQTALRSVTYQSTSDDPTVTAVNRTVTWAVTDANSDLVGAQTSVAVTSTITITPSNDKPVVTAGGTLAYAENAAATAIDGTMTVNDADDTQITGATATISAGLTTGDVLAVTTLDGISGTYNAGTGVLTLTGTKTLAQYQAAFRRVTYQSTSEDPTAIAGSRTVSWAVTDANSDLAGAQTSVAVTSTITITPINDKPIVTAGANLAYAENAAATAIDGTMTVNDADDTQIAGATATISAGLTTGDVLAVTTQNGISGTYSAGVLTLTGTATLADYQTALRSVTYQSTSEDPTATAVNRTVTWAVTDANSDLVGAQTSVAVTSTITITPSNDKPVVTAGATLAYTENAAATAIDGTMTVNDADDTQITGATATISAGLTTGDLLAVTTQNGISGTYSAGTGVLTLSGTATLANYQTALRSVTYHSTSDYPTQTSTSRTISWRVTDANSELVGTETSVAVTSTISITEVNDAPVNTYPAAIALYENASFSFTGLNALSVADVELNMASAQLSASGGTLLVNLAGGATISAGTNGRGSMTISGTQAQINAALASLTYSGNQHFNGLDTLTIVSKDADANPLTDTDSIAITVYSVNSAPAGGDGAVSVPMNGSYALKAADFGFNDSNDSPANLLTRVLVTSLPGSSKGTLALNGVAVSAGSYVTVADINAGLLVYTPPADENGFAYTSFTFQVEDDGGTANGGLNLDASTNLMTIHVGGIVPQSLCFVAPPEAPQSQVLSLYGNATSGLNVVYTVVSGPGTLVGNLLTFTGSGPVVVRASQPGDLTYRPASAVDQTINAVSLSIPISISDGWNVQHGTGASSQANAVALKLSGQVAQFVAVTGYVTGSGGKKDLYVTKRDATTGAEVWGKTHVGAAGLDDEGSAVAFDSAGNIVVAGHETNVSGNTDVVVLKYAAADGALLWSQKFVGTDGVTDKGADALGSYDASNRVVKGRKNLTVGPTDEVIVGGYVTNAGGGRDLLVVKYHSDGTKAWQQTYDGAAGVDYANAVAVDAAGDVYAAGSSRSASTMDGITLKYAAADGALVWHARYDNGKVDEVTSLIIDRDGNPVVGGYTQETTYDMFMVRYNKGGDPTSALATTVLWESRFDNPAYNSSESVWDMGLVFGKDVMLTGTSYSGSGVYNAYTMRFKGTCVEGARWDREYDGAVRGQDQLLALGADYFGSPVVVGYTQMAGGKYGIQTMKYDAEAGSLLWSKTYDSADGNSEPRAVAVDPSGNVFVAGYTTVAGAVTKVLVQNYSPYSNPTRAAQTISFTNPGAQLAGKTIILGASVDSGLQVEYAVISGPATVSGKSLVLRGEGNVTLRASQPGSGDYLPATPVEVTFSVSRSSQTISFNLPVKIHQVNGQWESFPLAGVCSSGLPLTYEVLSGPATITDGVLQLSGAGVVAVRASQIGDSSYDPAVSVDRTVTGEVMGSFTILDGFHVNWTDRSLLDVTDSSSFAEGEAVAVALGLTGNDATSGYVAGFVKGATGKDLYLTKYTHNISTGAAVQSWVRRMNGSASGDDEAAAVAVDASGNVIVAGYVTTSTGRDVYVAKYDSNGGDGTGTPGSSNPIWEYTYNGSGNGTDMALSLALQGTSHVIVGGRAAGSGTGDDFFAAKLNSSDGTAVWAKQNNRTTTLSDIPAKVAVGSDGTVVLAGISGIGNSANAWTVKLDSGSGALLWQKVYNYANKPDAMRGLALDGANNVIVSGYSQGTNYDMYTAKYEAGTGSIIWEKRHNGSFNSSDTAWDVIVDRQGYVLVTGTSYRASSVKDGMTLKYSGLDGTLEWAKRPFNNLGTATANDENFSIALDGLGNLVLVGYTSSTTTGTDYYVARHLNNGGGTDGDTAGEAVFDGYYGGNDNIYQVRMDPNGAIWMVGFTATVSGVRQPLVVRLAPGP
jgi:uncharacterized delta-60 repeat protein